MESDFKGVMTYSTDYKSEAQQFLLQWELEYRFLGLLLPVVMCCNIDFYDFLLYQDKKMTWLKLKKKTKISISVLRKEWINFPWYLINLLNEVEFFLNHYKFLLNFMEWI